MVALTRSSRDANPAARWSALVGLVAAAAVPAAVAVAETTAYLELIEAAWAIPGAFVLGLVAVWLARRGRRRTERTLGRVGGELAARTGRAFGALAIGLALAGAIAVGFAWYLTNIAD